MKPLAYVCAALVFASGTATAGARNSGGSSDYFAGIPRPVRAADFGSFPLDEISRDVDPRYVRCPDLELVTYRGAHIPFNRPTRIYVPFQAHLEEFEELVRSVAIEVYGRAPTRLVHGGTYHCREVRHVPGLLSEHGFGDAIDVHGFDFGAAARNEPLPAGLPLRLRHRFEVRVLAHWDAHGAVGDVHAHFFARLRAELEARPRLFRGMLGPGYPGHENHLHLDMAPWALFWMRNTGR
ncbi:MAG: extensin family protein [Sandaracinaceae bacterium]|nr:extensin family protein [Sandaracinaceae bacterium]